LNYPFQGKKEAEILTKKKNTKQQQPLMGMGLGILNTGNVGVMDTETPVNY